MVIGGRSDTNRAAIYMWQTWGWQIRCQINVKGERHCPPCPEWNTWMQRSSTTTGFIVKSSCVLHEMVGVLSDPEHGTAMCAVGTAARMVASWRTSMASSRPKFLILTSRFVNDTKSAMMSDGQGWLHTQLRLDLEGSSYTPPDLRLKVL